LNEKTTVGAACGTAIVILAIVLGFEAIVGEILHLIFPHVLGFWRWFGAVFAFSYLMNIVRGKRS
jgi:hypothetical protein